ncbi:wall-associated receptor kinase 2 isoform X2 [Brachypodium distachyon]|uniref:Protein kinase domain-containing protein n=2 Tax=Brachypodium distachyon TaxID=15368 RepID=A0A0Q3GBH7_BRADI|nr:wall-associated receptor kinase 2 isoform X2 [Brachypodium distachyon]XP_024315486.1 wall-associated receptor kinase 2 isoform X2 [Brachypodium distachyon]XP_024315487.1 wall-associated receptor kinase 2 isoform X2 [Brachypodium distachyon]XP_024315488.1 wall-associated receptor kinase 2 isoform X2 [Brachypodium distachyon]KQK07893.1 hypothetical protein BRADI_2g38260v3 [Brachypodium distachyon]|eukprot:XP_024315485.1 wall-associated receptor kinase 2 isoform X2 [Brachypodium distachyon]
MLLLLTSLAGATVEPEEAIGMPNCNITCGSMSVPYPFGMGPPGCYWTGFNLTCSYPTGTGKGETPRLLLGDGTLQVEDLDLANSLLQVTSTGGVTVDAAGNGTLGGGVRDGMPYTLLTGVNELTLTGCNVRATVKSGNITMASCSAVCDAYNTTMPDILTRDSLPCYGNRCCQAEIIINHQVVAGELVPITSYDVELIYLGWNRSSDVARVPTRVFIAKKGWFEQVWLATDHPDQPNQRPSEDVTLPVPIWLQWEVVGDGVEPADRNRTTLECPEEVARRVCKSKHSYCRKGTIGYTCSCADNFQGNPYITDGCKVVDKCKQNGDHRCYGVCTDTGNCTCPPGTNGNPYLPGGCASSVAGSCSHSCGDVLVPYPFGVGQDHHCYWEGFNLTCHDTGNEPPRLFLDNNMTTQIVEISTRNNTVRTHGTSVIRIPRPTDGTTGDGNLTIDLTIDGRREVPYSLSAHNEFILTGCNLMAKLTGDSEPSVVSACASFCSPEDTKKQNDQCNGMGCCKAPISLYNNSMPTGVNYKWFDKGYGDDESPSDAYLLLAEEGWFDQRRVSSELLPERWEFELRTPVLLQWEVLHGFSSMASVDAVKSSHPNCPPEVANSLCKSRHSYCKQGSRGGYSCHCNKGYDANPDSNPYISDGCRGRRKSFTTGIYIGTGVAIGAGLILSFFTASSVLKKLKHRRAQMLKQEFFEKNRGQLLRQLVSQRADIAERMIITLEEIEKATNNFDKARELGGGGHGTVYKGILSDLHVVAIKKPKMVVQREINEFINEVAILSQINHRNVVKLYGCCLETEVPLLVYEFISNGTLYEHLHTGVSRSLSWNDRLRIAVETAKSLAYLHSTASIPIIHRDVKSVNILLDDSLTAKVADFGASRYVPVDRSGVTTMVQGTIGYLDPMYVYTQRLTEKSDVYSFGVILVELLTRKKPFSYASPEGDGLVAHFASLFAEGKLPEILDPQAMEEGGKELEAVATLALSCVKLRGEDRPAMRQVELTLEAVRASNQDALANPLVEGCEKNVIAVNCPRAEDGISTEESTRQFSMEEELLLSSRYPR